MVRCERIVEKCRSGDDFIDDNTLTVNIARLRKKLAKIGAKDLIPLVLSGKSEEEMRNREKVN